MIRHIVAFKLKDYPTYGEKLHAIEAVKTALMVLPTKISVIRSFEVGIDALHGPASYDLVINSTFDSLEDLEIYRVHPDHQAFIEFNKNFTLHKVMVDYEI
ncbi:MAG: Dabb family protein [Bacteroidota bacterium]